MRFLFIHFLFLLFCFTSTAQCINDVLYSTQNVIAPSIHDSTSIDNLKTTNYLKMSDLDQNASYVFTSSIEGDFITIRSVDRTELIAYGPLPFVFRSESVDSVSVHINKDDGQCGDDDMTRELKIHNQFLSKVGVNTSSPAAALDVNGSIKISSNSSLPTEGMIRWNSEKSDFEGYNGAKWLSLTGKTKTWGSEVTFSAKEHYSYNLNSNYNSAGFGKTMDGSGSYIVTGSPQDTIENRPSEGSVFLLQNNVNQGLVLLSRMMSPDTNQYQRFGSAVAISDNFIAVSSDVNYQYGKVYIFTFDGYNINHHSTITDSTLSTYSHFGHSIDIDNNRLVVGAKNASNGEFFNGIVNIYTLENDSWVLSNQLYSPNPYNVSAEYGYHVRLKDSTLLISNPGKIGNFGSGNPGFVNYYSLNEQGQASLIHIYENPYNSGGSQFGQVVDFNDDFIFINAPIMKHGKTYDWGTVYIYGRKPANRILIDELTMKGDNDLFYSFGMDISSENNNLIVGHRKANEHHEHQGSAFIYYYNGSHWVLDNKIVASDASQDDNFGYQVLIESDKIYVSAPNNKNAFNKGKLYVFEKE